MPLVDGFEFATALELLVLVGIEAGSILDERRCCAEDPPAVKVVVESMPPAISSANRLCLPGVVDDACDGVVGTDCVGRR